MVTTVLLMMMDDDTGLENWFEKNKIKFFCFLIA